MKIGIVTVYNSYNCGSFLQAYALFRFLQGKSRDVFFVKRNVYKSNKFRARAKLALKFLLKGNPKRARFILTEYRRFRQIQKTLPIVASANDVDLAVYGSDTIWNMEDPYFAENWPRYWGRGVSAKKITYAASVGSTPAEVFYANPEFKRLAGEFAGVAVRDEHTREIASALLDGSKEPKVVVDPTMLIPVEEFDAVAKPCDEKDFILLYYFGAMPQKLRDALSAFAKANGKKIVSFGTTIPFEPGLMLSYYKAADYVITNTFHGNIFSILYNKNFVSFGKEKSKVRLLLAEFGLADRLFDVADDDWPSAFEKGVDFGNANRVLLEKRRESASYLESFLE